MDVLLACQYKVKQLGLGTLAFAELAVLHILSEMHPLKIAFGKLGGTRFKQLFKLIN